MRKVYWLSVTFLILVKSDETDKDNKYKMRQRTLPIRNYTPKWNVEFGRIKKVTN